MGEGGSGGNVELAQIMPSLTVGDIEASLAYYEGVLGFTVVDRWEHEGKLFGASVAAGDVSLMLLQDDWAQGRDREKGVGFRLYCTTRQNVDDLAAGIEARGGELAQEPTDQPWGSRDFSVVDPDGFKISIASHVES